MARLSLSFLGAFQVSVGDQVVAHFRSANVQGLLVYLALQARRPFPRDVLATLFWPDETDRKARKNLRQSLYQLRKVLGDADGRPQPFLHVSRQSVQFNPDSNHALDVATFLKGVADNDLETAVALYAELLPGFTCDGPEFEDWLRRERERLHALALKAMTDLSERQLRNGRIARAQATARRQLDFEPWSESAHRRLIEALALAGDRRGALAQFERCREMLAAEFDLTPEQETLALIERIENNKVRPLDRNLIAGRFALGTEIGRGSMGLVFQGRDSQSGNRVAIKKLDATVAGKPGLVSRFQREGEALRLLNHPNIVRLLAIDEKDNHHYLVMEYIPRGDLRQRLQQKGPLPLKEVLTIALDLADALTRAHRLEILHRDIKPSNVLLDGDGLPRLADFGLARLGHGSLLSSQDQIMGTVAYLSPEACLGEELDGRSDIWSFGVLLYEMLLGERPFSAPTAAGTIGQILNAPLADVLALRPEMPEALADLLYRMLTKSKVDRIPSVRLVGAELEVILEAAVETIDPDQSEAQPSSLHSRSAFATPTTGHLLRVPHNLPAPATPFVGRKEELGELERLLADPSPRLVTLVGPGGMGKTRLSLEAARRAAEGESSTDVAFSDGVFFVELGAVDSVEQMFPTIATALGFALEKEIEPQQQLINYLVNKRALLLLDNFEQLLAAPNDGAEVVAAFLQGAPGVKMIVTSRQKLNLNGETLFNIEGLAYPDWHEATGAMAYSAVRLFAQSARRARVDFELDERSLQQVVEICRLAEGMPLGILLAAAWVDLLSLPEIVREMRADIDFLAGERRDLPPRQRSMRAVFDYSWALLTENEKDILAKLSVFRGGFTREAAQAVTGATLRQLLALVHKSLVQRDVASGRFALHVLLRELAAEKLKAAGEADDVRTAHSDFYFQLLASSAPSHRTSMALTPDTQNLKAAWLWGAKHGDTARLIPVIEPLHVYFNLVGREFELFVLWLKALSLLPTGDPTFQNIADDVTAARAAILNRLQESGYEKDQHEQPIDIDRLHAFFRRRGAKLEEAIACQHLSYRALGRGDFKQALFYFQTQARLYAEVNATFRLTTSLAITAMMAFRAGEVERGLALARRSLSLAKQSDDALNRLAPSASLAFYTLHAQVDYENAARQYAEVATLGLRLWREGLTANPAMIGLAWQGFIALLEGDLSRARQFAHEMGSIADVRNNPRDKGSAACFSTLLEATAGNYQAVDRNISESVAIGHTEFASYSLILNACGVGNVAAARAGLVREWSQPMAMRWPSVLLYVLPAAVFVLAEKGELPRAASLLAMGRAHPARPRGWWGVMVLVRELEARLQAALSAEAYSAAQAQGQELDLQETVVALREELKEESGRER